ncbi:hypothetical protein EK21DRAFT_80478, partial [Setomelanomma holmii]
QKKALADLNTDTSKTIAARHIHLIKDHKTPYDRLVALKNGTVQLEGERHAVD